MDATLHLDRVSALVAALNSVPAGQSPIPYLAEINSVVRSIHEGLAFELGRKSGVRNGKQLQSWANTREFFLSANGSAQLFPLVTDLYSELKKAPLKNWAFIRFRPADPLAHTYLPSEFLELKPRFWLQQPLAPSREQKMHLSVFLPRTHVRKIGGAAEWTLSGLSGPLSMLFPFLDRCLGEFEMEEMVSSDVRFFPHDEASELIPDAATREASLLPPERLFSAFREALAILLRGQGPDAEALLERCPTCGYSRVNCDLAACSRCHKVHYCSKQCQKLHWPTHKPDCVAPDPSQTTPIVAEAMVVPAEEGDASKEDKKKLDATSCMPPPPSRRS